MKVLRKIGFVVAIAAATMTMSSCGGESTEHNHEHTGKEYTSEYVCPMHCEGSGSDKAGQCTVCGMDYVKNDKE